MTQPSVLFVKPQSINAEDKRALREIGVVLVEVDDPAMPRFVTAAPPDLTTSDMLSCAAKAMTNKDASYSSSVRELFGHEMAKALIAKATPA